METQKFETLATFSYAHVEMDLPDDAKRAFGDQIGLGLREVSQPGLGNLGLPR